MVLKHLAHAESHLNLTLSRGGRISGIVSVTEGPELTKLT